MIVLLPAIQFALILLLTTVCGSLAQRLRQPRVVGEITGGLLLGPLALGGLFPATYAAIFPTQHLQALGILSNIGLVVFLFLTGAELDLKSVNGVRGATLAVTLGNIGLPFAFGAAIAPALRTHFGLTSIAPLPFLLFPALP